MRVKNTLLKLYYFASLSKEKTDFNQKIIRDVEWDAIKQNIPLNSKFLDVGCGAGYAMRKAQQEFNCDCHGIDPEPGAHGVGRFNENSKSGLNIVQGFSEQLPYSDQSFQVVYSSHVLEHVNDESKSLAEMKRVLTNDGKLIIGMPTADMAWVNLWTEVLFTTHQRVFNVIFQFLPYIKTGKTSLVNAIIPCSHSTPRAKTIFYDLEHYKIENWKKTVEEYFKIDETILPAFYPYPQYWQLFKMKKNYKKSSSVFFICSKK